MNIIKFIKDRKNFIYTYYLGIALAIFINALGMTNTGGNLEWGNIIYIFILVSIILFVLIFIEYKKTSSFIGVVEEGDKNTKDLQNLLKLPENLGEEYDIIRQAFLYNYKYYINELDRYRENMDIQVHFNNRWIHEMKTPVSVIKLILEKEKEAGLIDKNLLDSIEEEIEKLSNGLEMALYTIRINKFEEDFKVERVEITGLIRTIINENKTSFIRNSIYPSIDISGEVFVNTDKKWINFIFKQIISNSIKYTRVKDTKEKKIRIGFDIKDNKKIITIEDTGVGIKPSDLERVYNPFFTGENGRKYLESTGMGLYLVRSIVKKLGHNIEIESTYARGTRVSIIFNEGQSIYDIN